MPKLNALVATAVLINGERTVIQPGEELPEISRHDARELLAAGAIEDVNASLETELALADAEAKALQEFAQAREAVQAAAASIAPDTDDTAPAVAAADASTNTQASAPRAARNARK